MKFIFLALMLIPFHLGATVKVVGDNIEIKNDQKFEEKLELKNFDIEGTSAHLNETGFIVAATQFTFGESSTTSNWVTMDEKILARESVDLSKIKISKGIAYGILTTSLDFEPKLKVGQLLQVKRYGIARDNFSGRILKLVKRDGQDIVRVHFLVSNAEELIPGTSLEITIEQIKLIPFKISPLSLLHIGLEDYIVVKIGEGLYTPRHVTVLDQNEQHAVVMLPLEEKVPYVARGAILLKPVLSQILNREENARD